eukprot:TRINITY_DN73453_c0_g1_i1.p1 TRINITY_DN73453_c0_g1~~TRINITY_DN73453_c0_g1_i1.p1  ORF type:complete len:331 (-),score=41.67 TRINITY_DN73453_c0_g1_i1:123-1115(-)
MSAPLLSAGAVAVVFAATGVSIWLSATPGSRPFVSEETVRQSYNDWTDDGVLEYYWGDHIHLGYYGDDAAPRHHPNGSRIDFRRAKYDMTTHLFEWGHRIAGRALPSDKDRLSLLDMGCGFGGSTRHLTTEYGLGNAVGITLSDSQVNRARQLTASESVRFERMDATSTTFADGSFGILWSLEMEPHVLDKSKMVNEMLRVLKPGGLLILGCWNVRDTRNQPLSADEAELVRFLREEWSHPNFWSIEQYKDAFAAHPQVQTTYDDDWTVVTYPSWGESIMEGFRRPWGAIRVGPSGWYKIARETLGILRMRTAFGTGLMKYGVFAVVKRQ